MAEQGSVVVFPGAGSFGGEFSVLLSEYGRAAFMARYPGRFGRDFGTGAGSFDEVVDACVAQVRRRGAPRPVLVGHSYGAYVAYATASRLRDGDSDVGALVVVGARAPGLLSVPPGATADPEGTAEFLRGADPALLTGIDDEWRDIIVQTACRDLRLLRELPAGGWEPLDCPVTAVRGASDPLTDPDGIAAWAGTTRGAFGTVEFAGGHSQFLGSTRFVEWLGGDTAAAA